MDELEDVSIQFLREITDGFSEQRKVGEGAFGVVHKGVTKNGGNVAVKKLKLGAHNVDCEQFRNEFYNLRRLKHQNIVQVLGYCYETEKGTYSMPDGSKVHVEEIHAALCFEYLPNRSLQKHLSDEQLDWQKRFKIIKGTCEGLKYIHGEHIYHLDLKPDNILLDKDMVPKIADFGLSRIYGKELPQNTQSCLGTPGHHPPEHIERRDSGLSRSIHGEELPQNTQSPLGTLGYQPPEYIDSGEISSKFDIFSLGIIMIQIVSGVSSAPEASSNCRNMSSDKFVDQVQQSWWNKLQATCSSDLLKEYCHQVETCTRIALDCMQGDSRKRPNIVEISEKLNEIETDILKLPQEEMRKEPKDIPGGHPNIKLGIDLGCSDLEFIDAPQTPSDVVEELIVGRTEEKEKIMVLLKSSSEKIIILPIYGIGGIGKTTFARMIYNDPKFNGYSRVWVHVSQRFDLHKILDSINSQLREKEGQANERQMIHSCLTNLPHDKKIMIVLDDLWEDNPFQLHELKDKLYRDNINIIILVTTRSESVAERIYINLQPYKILPLTNDMCWDIIKQRSGLEGRDDKEQLMDIGQEIARKCGGVALAALSLGFTLRSMKNFDQWVKVKDSDIWKESVSKDFSLPNHVLASLKLSYSYMSLYLKQCFTYCATFPKGHKIVKHDLIYQWISLDLIKPAKLLSNMEICEKYIVQLLGLSFFQQSMSPKTSDAYYEQAPFFTMHDLVHDLANSLLGSRILDQSKQGYNTRGSSCEYALLSDCSKPLELSLTFPKMLIALHFLDGCKSKALIGAAFAPATSLRVLDLKECSIPKLPDSIGQLKQLRHLNAPRIQDVMVPECITSLSNLVYLNLHKSSSIRELPESIGEMGSLMHLDLSDCYSIFRLPVSFGNLKKLVHLDLSECGSISGLSESLRNLSRLEHLDLEHCYNLEDPTGAVGGLTELQYLNLSGLSCFGLQQVLINLNKLRYLNLYASLGDGRADGVDVDGLLECVSSLSNLEYLNLSCNIILCTIPETIGNLTKLNTLDLSYCFNLERLPDSLSAMSSLKFLRVPGCCKLDKSTLPQNKNSSALLPHFVVHASDDESSSNLSELEDKHHTLLEVSRLENVKSAEEVKRINLAEKQSIEILELSWTRDAKRFVDDREVLTRLQPPDTLVMLRLKGYNGISFPSWMMSIATYLPHLEELVMEDLPSCNVLPPLGQLPNLYTLKIGGMDRIRKIDGEFYGGRRAFPQLEYFSLSCMESLEEWNPAYCIDEDSPNELAFPRFLEIHIDRCPLLRLKACLPHCGRKLFISRSDEVLLSSWENRGHVGSAATTSLRVSCCGAPLHQWSLLRHLPCLAELEITDCSDLTCSSTDLLRCLSSLKTLTVKGSDRKNAIVVLPERLGDLTSLKELKIRNCKSIKSLPDSIRQLSCLLRLDIDGCPKLVQWCESEENWVNLPHIQDIILNGKRFLKTKTLHVRQPKFFDFFGVGEPTLNDQNQQQPTPQWAQARQDTMQQQQNHVMEEEIVLTLAGPGDHPMDYDLPKVVNNQNVDQRLLGDDLSPAIESDQESESQVEEMKLKVEVLQETTLGALPHDEEYDPYNEQHVRQSKFFDFFGVGEPTLNDQNQQQPTPQWAQARQDTMQQQQNHVMEEEIVLTLAGPGDHTMDNDLPKFVNNQNVDQRLLGADLSLAINVP